MKHIVSLSGGVSSAVAADLVISRYGRENTLLWFADTLWEDEDLYRFVDDCMLRWGGELIRYCDGRTPLQVAEDQNIVPNSFVAPCTRRLKIEPFKKFVLNHEKPLTVHIGIGWDEIRRAEAPKKNYESIEGVTVDFPLMWDKISFQSNFSIVKNDWGIEPPRLYSMGFPHNNCGGRCIRQGISEWNRLRVNFPERFNECRDWEKKQRELDDNRKDHSIMKKQIKGHMVTYTLEQLEKDSIPVEKHQMFEDLFSCFCSL